MSNLRSLPKVDAVLERAQELVRELGRPVVVDSIRRVLDDARRRMRDGDDVPVTPEAIADRAAALARIRCRPALRRVVNATGVVLHTGLGRAVLPPEAVDAIAREQRGYSLLEIDAETGERGVRETAVSRLLCELTGAEAATVVNNNAGATLLALAALAVGREVVCSRGQLVEIGGSFRIPDVMEASGARLTAVGATNRTRLADYEKAITPDTALLLRVHTSNYRIVGFTETPTLDQLIELGRKRSLPVMDDLGSGAMLDFARYGLQGEPVVADSVRAGADVICFSGDKLLGGPQAGILVGRKDPIARIRKHPLFRALRPDKLQLTALEVTLQIYRDPDRVVDRIPTLKMIAMPQSEIERRARELCDLLAKIDGVTAEVADDASQVGGGSLPGENLPTKVVALRHRKAKADPLAARLRAHDPPVFARIVKDRVVFDVRTLQEGDAGDIADALAHA